MRNLPCLLLSSALLLGLTACGDGGPEQVETPLPPPSGTEPSDYAGPPPATDDIQQFKLAVWDNVSGSDRCGRCHNAGGQSPSFARADDINLAYAEINPFVDLTSPEQSLLVTKVAGGHNCWQGDAASCAEILTGWLQNWVGTEEQGNRIVLTAPPINEPGSRKSFPADANGFADTVYPLLTRYCSDCHSNQASLPISPFFASDDIDEAYAAVTSKIDLDTPSRSRLVVRLGSEFHNCWDSCTNNAAEMLNAIETFAEGIVLTEIDDDLLHSKALVLSEGIPASSGGRIETNMIALWQFKTGSGTTAYDTSGIDPAMNLTLTGEIDWIGGWGIQLKGGRAQSSTAASKKLHDLIRATGEFSVEAWVAPANVTQEGPARIISYSAGDNARNFTLGQTLYNYDFLMRQSSTDQNGMPALSTADADERLQATLQHVVINYDPIRGRQIFVNGQYTGDSENNAIGNINEWDESFAFVIGNEVTGDNPWSGSVRLVAIHNRALSAEQIKQNYDVGVGERFYLLFNISEYVDIPDSYIVFKVSQFDNYSYLFSDPFYLSLDKTVVPNGVPLAKLRIGINGREAPVGQAYKHLSVELNADNYRTEEGQPLSRLGTLVSVEKGPEQDEFFLTFEQLGDYSNVYVEANPPAPAPPQDRESSAEIGVRTFADINATMSALTGVSMQQAEIQQAYSQLQQQLPRNSDMQSFVASNQMAVAQLGIKYCNQLIEDTALRQAYFPQFNFSLPVSQAFSAEGRANLLSPLLNKMIGNGMSVQPERTDVEGELNSLIDILSTCAQDTCDSQRTKTIAKASCAATISSAAMIVQ